MIIVFICVIALFSYGHSVDLKVDPLVKIDQGLVRGRRATDGYYSTFLGIPYANVDENNPFGPALPAPTFENEIFNAYESSTICPQAGHATNENYVESLDCLKLNIYVPFEAAASNPLPVLVFVHGGRFSFGSSAEFTGIQKIVQNGIIVVTINYRLGAYGFMCLDIPQVPGNQGLKDQYAALLWIRRNISAFGGNPYNVTLSGQSAGSCSVLLHLYSDKQKLFHKVIAQSGTPQSDGMFVNGDTEAAIKLAQNLGFNTTDTEEALDFLTNTPHDLVSAAAEAIDLILRPCKESYFSGVENFVESDPYSLSNMNKIRNTPILIGHTSKEEIGLKAYPENYYDSDPFYTKIANNFNLNDEQLQTAAKSVRHFYVGDEPISNEFPSKYEEFESDFVFNHPTQRMVTKFLEEDADPIYEYMFSYTGDSDAEGASHSAELAYLFNSPMILQSEKDQLISDRITTLWSNFVKYGNPTPQPTDLLPVTWTPVTKDLRPYLIIDSDIRMENRVYKERMSFWDLFYSTFGSYNTLLRECNL